jgi:ABC-type polysaccharide/polyol phosphate export permease
MSVATSGPEPVTLAGGRGRENPWHYRALILNFARRDLGARFKGTLLGAVWSLVAPLATLVIYSIVFGIIFKGEPPPLGTGEDGVFFVWLFSGLVPWGMYAITISTAIASLIGNGPLLKKIYFPAYASILGSVGATFFQSLIEFGILAAALLILGNIGLSWLLLPGWLVVFAVFVASLALLLSVANVYLRDTAHLVSIVLQLQFYMTPIIYQVSLVPEDWHGIPLRTIVEYQPMAVYVELFRALVYDLSTGPATLWLWAVIWTGLALGGAVLVYRRWGLDLAEEL